MVSYTCYPIAEVALVNCWPLCDELPCLFYSCYSVLSGRELMIAMYKIKQQADKGDVKSMVLMAYAYRTGMTMMATNGRKTIVPQSIAVAKGYYEKIIQSKDPKFAPRATRILHWINFEETSEANRKTALAAFNAEAAVAKAALAAPTKPEVAEAKRD